MSEEEIKKFNTAEEIKKKLGTGKIVITASRRTDIPAFHLDEFLTGLRNGRFCYQALMQQLTEIQFGPSDIHSIGLWSQDFSKWIQRRGEIEDLRYKFWYRFTILPDDPVCKPKAPPVADQLKQLEALVDKDGPEVVFLFIDPLIKYRRIGKQDWQYNFSTESLGQIFSKAKEFGIQTVTTSILDYYKKIERRTKKKGIEFRFFDLKKNPSDEKELLEMVGIFKGVADEFGMTVKSCCEKFLHLKGVTSEGACVDGRLLNKLFGYGASENKDPYQRAECLCTRSLDIGRYREHGEYSHHCGHECLQCYARP